MKENTCSLDDFSEMINSFLYFENSDKVLRVITGIGGLLTIRFMKFGKQKLPRKLKKKIYFTAKLRKQHIPQYYERNG